MRLKFIAFVIFFLLLSIPFVQAEETKKIGNMYEITKHVKIERGNGTIPLNLSDPQELKKYSPVNNFWDTNLTGNGKIVDGILPPDFMFLNTSTLNLTWNFTLSSDMVADGASVFVIRLPVSFDASNNYAPLINLTISMGSQKVLYLSNFFNNVICSIDQMKDKVITYVNLTLHLWYLNLTGLLYPSERYTMYLNLSYLSNVTLLIYNYDYLQDNSTEFFMNNRKYTADLATGFEFKQLISNGISAIKVVGPNDPHVYPPANYTQKIALDSAYSGKMYVSFAIELYLTSETTSQVPLEIIICTGNNKNSTDLTNLSAGLQTIRGNMQLNFTGENYVNITIRFAYSFYVIFEGYSKYPANGTFITDDLHIYIKPYMDLVVNPEEYYLPGAIVLPGSWQKSFALALKYAPSSYLPVVLTNVIYLTTIYTFLKVFAYASYLMYKAENFVWGIIKDLLHDLFDLFKWVYDAVVHWLISDVGMAIWALLEALWFIFQVVIYIAAVWITDSFLRGIAVLPERGFKGMLEEWSGVTSFIEGLAGRIGGIIGRFRK